MNIKAKLRRIGNSMGVILPANVITGYNKGDEITLDVITKDAEVTTNSPKVITRSDKRSAKAFEITKNVKTSCADILQEVNSGLSIDEAVGNQMREGLAPDGFPIQHTNSMKVGYVPEEVAV